MNPAPTPMSEWPWAQLGARKKPDLRSIATAWSAPLARLGNNSAAARLRKSSAIGGIRAGAIFHSAINIRWKRLLDLWGVHPVCDFCEARCFLRGIRFRSARLIQHFPEFLRQRGQRPT